MRIYDFVNGTFEKLYSKTHNGNAVNIQEAMIYLRLLRTNEVEVVHYDVQNNIEVNRLKHPNQF